MYQRERSVEMASSLQLAQKGERQLAVIVTKTRKRDNPYMRCCYSCSCLFFLFTCKHLAGRRAQNLRIFLHAFDMRLKMKDILLQPSISFAAQSIQDTNQNRHMQLDTVCWPYAGSAGRSVRSVPQCRRWCSQGF